MTLQEDSNIERDAAHWHAQLLGGEADWEGFARWLDAAPGHQPAYDRIALLDAEVGAWISEQGMPAIPEQEEKVRNVSRWWLGGAAAASLLALVAGISTLGTFQGRGPVIYATNGAQKMVELTAGSRVRLDQRTRLVLLEDGQVRLDRGAAYFDLHHDGNRPVEIQSGNFTVRDIGTRFTVTRDQGGLFVAVAEGLVDVSWQGGPPVRLGAGQTFQGDEGSGSGEIGTVEPAAVGSWRDGRLVYDNAPLALVAADLSRYTGVPVEVEPAVARLKLSGILLIRNGSDLVDQVTAILPVEARRSEGHIRLVGRARR